MGAAYGKTDFTFYRDVKPHYCAENLLKREELFCYYQHGPCLTMELQLVNNRNRYVKKLGSIQPSCNCPEKKVRLFLEDQIAVSYMYKPNEVYEYETKQIVNTSNGYNRWLLEISRSLWIEEEFLPPLVPGIMFFDGLFIQQIAKKMQISIDFDCFLVRSEPEFEFYLKEFINFAVDLNENSFVVCEISNQSFVW